MDGDKENITSSPFNANSTPPDAKIASTGDQVKRNLLDCVNSPSKRPCVSIKSIKGNFLGPINNTDSAKTKSNGSKKSVSTERGILDYFVQTPPKVEIKSDETNGSKIINDALGMETFKKKLHKTPDKQLNSCSRASPSFAKSSSEPASPTQVRRVDDNSKDVTLDQVTGSSLNSLNSKIQSPPKQSFQSNFTPSVSSPLAPKKIFSQDPSKSGPEKINYECTPGDKSDKIVDWEVDASPTSSKTLIEKKWKFVDSRASSCGITPKIDIGKSTLGEKGEAGSSSESTPNRPSTSCMSPANAKIEINPNTFEELIVLYLSSRDESTREFYRKYATGIIKAQEPLLREALKSLVKAKSIIFPKVIPTDKAQSFVDSQKLKEEKMREKEMARIAREEQKKAKEAERVAQKKAKDEEKKAREEERLRKKKLIEEQKLERQKAREDASKEREGKTNRGKDKSTELSSQYFMTFFSPIARSGVVDLANTTDSTAATTATTTTSNAQNDGDRSGSDAFSGPNPYFKAFEVRDRMEMAPGRNVDVRTARENMDSVFVCAKDEGETEERCRGGAGKCRDPASLLSDHLSTWRAVRRRQQTARQETSVGEDAMDGTDWGEDDAYSERNMPRWKYLHFSENVRPAYYGTWSKESLVVTGRRPFRKDDSVLDYEFDSDEEWEEEPGESLSQSELEDDGSEAEDEADGFVVPHGYLSEGEGGKECDEEDGGGGKICM